MKKKRTFNESYFKAAYLYLIHLKSWKIKKKVCEPAINKHYMKITENVPYKKNLWQVKTLFFWSNRIITINYFGEII